MEYVFAAIGLFLLFVGGEGLVRGASVIAARMGLSALLIGVIVVGFGTSTPELIVSVEAALKGNTGIALGNIVGSNIANVLLILSMAAVITRLACKGNAVIRDAAFVIFASVALFIFALMGEIGRIGGVAMLGVLGAYLFYCVQSERKAASANDNQSTEQVEIPKLSLPVAIILAIGGIAVLMLGANFLIKGATQIARDFGISEAIIGLTLVAVGTSLPELAASVIGAIRKQTDMVVGNILGSNFYNILGILGVASAIKPIPVDGRIATLDIPINIAVAVATLVVIIAFKRIGRVTGFAALGLYVAYVGWMFTSGNI